MLDSVAIYISVFNLRMVLSFDSSLAPPTPRELMFVELKVISDNEGVGWKELIVKAFTKSKGKQA